MRLIQWHFVLIGIVFLFGSTCLAASTVGDGTAHDLSKAEVMDRTILAVMEDYYDSTRMDPVAMFKGAMDDVVVSVAEVKVSYPEKGAKDNVAIVDVLDATLKIDFDAMNSPWGLSKAFHRIFTFLYEKLPKNEHLNYRTIEYAAVNGLLATLDPHTSAMTPDVWEELRMSTRGAFEGIGIRITTDYREPCGGDLTVVDVFKGTPAEKAGMKMGDKIVRIEGDSTVNITTGEAADQLRGEPGTKVKVGILRKDGSKKTLHIVRQRIPIDSVKWKMLADMVGYIELSAFQSGSADEMKDALEKLHEDGMKGLVLDLRSNPGGLLGAAIDIADLFISNGTLVTTAGRTSEQRDVTNATTADTEPAYPIVILIDGYTASAAEILSGALRNHGRALLVGEPTFGKGSVQNIISLPDSGAMRLTIQQYLIPGDISIQAVGVAPDILFDPAVVDKKELLISRRERSFSEASLDSHLTRASKIERGDRPGALRMPYFVSSQDRKTDLNTLQKCYAGTPERKSFRNRYEVEFARKLVSKATGVTTAELLVTARKMIKQMAAAEKNNLSAALGKLGVNWARLEDVSLANQEEMIPSDDLNATANVEGPVKAGHELKIGVTVKNGSKDTLYQLRAKTKSDNPYLSGIDLVFGQLAPGKTKKWTATAKLPPIARSRIDPVEIEFFSAQGKVPAPVTVDAQVVGRIPPELVYDWYLEDLGNGNGYLEPGETFKMHMSITNRGAGNTYKMEANLSSRPGLDVESGRFVIEPLRSKKSVRGFFLIAVPELQDSEEPIAAKDVELSLSFDEWVPAKIPSLFNLQHQNISLPVSVPMPTMDKADGTIAVAQSQAAVFTTPSSAGTIAGRAPTGSIFSVDGSMNGFFRIKIGDGRFGWISNKNTAPGGKPNKQFVPNITQLPKIDIDGADSQTVNKAEVVLKGLISHPHGLRDLLVFVDGKKVEYEQVKGRANEQSFVFTIPIEPGANNISVMARHDNHIVASKSLFVRRVE